MGTEEHPAVCTTCGSKQKMLLVRSPNVQASDRDCGTFKEQKQLSIHFCVSTSVVKPVRKLVCSVSFPQMTEFLPYCYCFNMISFPILCCFLHPPLPSAEDPAPSQRVHTDSRFSIQHN